MTNYKEKARGTCYEDALRFLIREEEGDLVHGSVETISGKRVNHAWVDLPTGYIWEPQYEAFFTREEFEQFKPKEHARYSGETAAVKALRTGNFGPWAE